MNSNLSSDRLTDSYDVRAVLASKVSEQVGTITHTSKVQASAVDTEMLPIELDAFDESTQYEIVTPVSQGEIEKMLGHKISKITVPVIKDMTGRFSDVLDAVSSELGVNVIPFRLVEFPTAIVELQRYDIEVIGAEKFAVSRDIRIDVIKEYTERIMDAIQTGNVFVENLWVEIDHNGINAKTLRLSKYELSYLCASFEDFNPQIKRDNGSGDILFEVKLL